MEQTLGKILLGSPANSVAGLVAEITILEKKYKIIDWIDDTKSNQLGQLHTIYDVAKSLVTDLDILPDTAKVTIVDHIVPKTVELHSRIVVSHEEYHNAADQLRQEINTKVEQINTIVRNVTGIDDGDSQALAEVKRDQKIINSLRSQLINIVDDNAKNINADGEAKSVKFDETSEADLSVQYVSALNKMDYNVVDQLANIERTTDDAELHPYVDNSDHLSTDIKGHAIDSEIEVFSIPTSAPTEPIPTPEEVESHINETVTDENRKYDLDGDGVIDGVDVVKAEVYSHIGEEVTDENKKYDFDNDNDIDLDDVALASTPTPTPQNSTPSGDPTPTP